MLTNQEIKKALYTYEIGLNVKIFFLRIVAYSETKVLRVFHVVRTSKLIGVISEEMETKNIGKSCPVLPIDRCGQDDDLPPCPPTHQKAENNFYYKPDEIC